MVHTYAKSATTLLERYPNAGGVLDTIQAGAEGASAELPAVEAGAVRSFVAAAGKLVWVRALGTFLVNCEHVLEGDFVQLEDAVARRLIQAGQAIESSDAEVNAAQKKG